MGVAQKDHIEENEAGQQVVTVPEGQPIESSEEPQPEVNTQGQVLTDQVATEDITEENDAGQTVILVPKGQRIPEGVDAPKSKAKKA